jgi:hypothetical protein
MNDNLISMKHNVTKNAALPNGSDEFGGLCVRVRGHQKVMAHLMFVILALTVDQFMRFAT